MRRAVSFALTAMALCALAIVAVVVSHVGSTQIISALGSSLTSAADHSHEFFGRTLTSIHLDYSLIDRTRVLAIKHLHAAQNSTVEALVLFVDAGSHFIRQAMKRYRFLRSTDAPRFPRPSVESITYFHQPGPYPRDGSQYDLFPWDIASCPPPQDPSENPSTVCLIMATSAITTMILVAIISAISTSSAILSSMRFPWRCVKALADRLLPKPKKNMTLKVLLARLSLKVWETWGAICEELVNSVLDLVVSGFALLAILSTSLLYFIGNFVVFAHNVDIGLKLRVPPPPPPPAPPAPPPEEIIRYIADPEVPKLKMENEKLRKEAKDKDDENCRLSAKIEDLSHQVEYHKTRGDRLKTEKDLAVEEKKESDAQSAEQLKSHGRTISSLMTSLGAKHDQLAAVQEQHASCEDRYNAKDEECKFFIARILSLEDDIKALNTQLEELSASQTEDGGPPKKELQERDETIESQKKDIQNLKAQLKQQTERQASQKKLSGYTKRSFDREMTKMKNACKQKSADHKAAEAKCKAEAEARNAAEARLKAEAEARKAAEKSLQAEKTAREQAEAALEAERKAREAADSNASKSNAEVALLKVKLANGRSSYGVDNGTQTSGLDVPPPHLREKLSAKPPKSSGAKNVPPAPQHSNGSAISDKNIFKMPRSFNFSAFSAEEIFGVGPSRKPETPPADPSPEQPTPSVEQPEQPEPPESHL